MNYSTETVARNTDKKLLYETKSKGCHSSVIGRLFTRDLEIRRLNSRAITLFTENQRVFCVESKHKIKMREINKKFIIE